MTKQREIKKYYPPIPYGPVPDLSSAGAQEPAGNGEEYLKYWHPDCASPPRLPDKERVRRCRPAPEASGIQGGTGFAADSCNHKVCVPL